MNKDMNKCPKCGSLAKTVLYSTVTLMGYATTAFDRDGNLIPSINPNVTENYYKCSDCGEQYNAKQK